MNEVDSFIKEGCTQSEFEKVRNGLEFTATAKHLKVQNIAVETIFNYLYFEDAMRINDENERYLSVKREEVTSVAEGFLTGSPYVVINYLPLNGNSQSK
jgi:hypothetical protein